MMMYRNLWIGYLAGFFFAYSAEHPWWHAVLMGIVGASGFVFGWWLLDYAADQWRRRRHARV